MYMMNKSKWEKRIIYTRSKKNFHPIFPQRQISILPSNYRIFLYFKQDDM